MKNILGNAVLFQALSLLMAFAAREQMINLYAITATSFWSNTRATHSNTQALCHRPVTGFCWVEEAYFTSRLWQLWSIKIFDEWFFQQFKLEVDSEDPESHMGPAQSGLLETISCLVPRASKDGEPLALWVTSIIK